MLHINVVIIGNSAAAISAAEHLRYLAPEAGITMVTEEDHPPYSRCLLAEVVAGVSGLEGIRYRSDDFYEKQDIRLVRGVQVTSIDPLAQKIVLSGHGEISYDRLLVAAGASPVGLKTPGADLDGVCVLRNYEQAQNIGRRASAANHAVVVGGGLVGLKAAYGLRRRGVPSVTVVVKSNHLLMRQLDPESAAMVEKELREAGVDFLYGLNPTQLVPAAGQKTVEAAILEDGRELPAGLVLVGKGVRPNTGLVSQAGGEVGNGVKVDAFLETTLPGIYAAGDCIEVTDRITGSRTPSALWTLAVEQGRYAACSITGKKKTYPQPLTRLNSAQFGKLPFISVGAIDEGEEYLAWRDKGYAYRKLAIKEDRLIGFIMVGAIEQAGVYTSLIQAKKPLGALYRKLSQGKITAADLIS